MGQARVKRDVLRQILLKKGEEWDFPPSPWEVAVCAEMREEDVARRMDFAKRYPSIASYGDDGFRRLNPSYALFDIDSLIWRFI